MKRLLSILTLLTVFSMALFADTHRLAAEIKEYVAKNPIDSQFPLMEKEIKASSMALNRQGYALYEKKKYQDAIAKFRQAVKDDETNSIALYNLACCYALTEDMYEAAASLEKAIAYQPLWGILCMVDSDFDGIRNCSAPEKKPVSFTDRDDDPYIGFYTLNPDGRAEVGNVGYSGYFCLIGETVFVFCDVPDNPEYAELGRDGFLLAKAIPASKFGMK